MEIVLQWLDELDDAVFAIALAAERLRRGCIRIGALSAVALAGCSASAALEWVPLLGAIAAGSVAAAVGIGGFAAFAEAYSVRPGRAEYQA
ncbi:MAG: hypothetical protein LOD94_14785 [Gammaproteobacteria bacterium]|nr:hypothetical protein [Gammaproteobacteria bacterium]